MVRCNVHELVGEHPAGVALGVGSRPSDSPGVAGALQARGDDPIREHREAVGLERRGFVRCRQVAHGSVHELPVAPSPAIGTVEVDPLGERGRRLDVDARHLRVADAAGPLRVHRGPEGFVPVEEHGEVGAPAQDHRRCGHALAVGRRAGGTGGRIWLGVQIGQDLVKERGLRRANHPRRPVSSGGVLATPRIVHELIIEADPDSPRWQRGGRSGRPTSRGDAIAREIDQGGR
jgi:hypothetical protein